MAKEKKIYSPDEIKERRKFVIKTMLWFLGIALIIVIIVLLIQAFVIKPSL